MSECDPTESAAGGGGSAMTPVGTRKMRGSCNFSENRFAQSGRVKLIVFVLIALLLIYVQMLL
jgi:hypothetical protein